MTDHGGTTKGRQSDDISSFCRPVYGNVTSQKPPENRQNAAFSGVLCIATSDKTPSKRRKRQRRSIGEPMRTHDTPTASRQRAAGLKHVPATRNSVPIQPRGRAVYFPRAQARHLPRSPTAEPPRAIEKAGSIDREGMT